MDSIERQIQRTRAVWDALESSEVSELARVERSRARRESAQAEGVENLPEVSGEEREVLELLEKSEGAVTIFELRARSSSSGVKVEEAIKSLRRKRMIRLRQESGGHIIVRLTAAGKEALTTR